MDVNKNPAQEMALDIELDDTRYLVKSLLFLALPLLIYFAADDLLTGRWVIGGLLSLMTLALVTAFLFTLKTRDKGKERRIHLIGLSAFSALLGLVSIYTFGVEGQVNRLPWAYLFVALVLVAFEIRWGLLWAGAFLALLVGSIFHFAPPASLLPQGLLPRFTVSCVLMVVIFGRLRNARQRRQRDLVVKHVALRESEQRLGEAKLLLEQAIEERALTEEALRTSEEKYRRLVENAYEGVCVMQDGVVKYVNPRVEEFSGYRRGEMIGRPLVEFVAPIDRAGLIDRHQKRLRGEEVPQSYEARLIDATGQVRWFNISGALIEWEGRPATLNLLLEVSERKRAEEALKSALKEKEVLLREIHHRVKNNMQVISSLLSLQAHNAKDERLIEAFKESQGRVRAMALIHETLYRSDDMATIDLREYLSTLAQNLIQAYQTTPGRMNLRVEAEKVALGLDQAVPLGLILNELVSNSLKHAFPRRQEGTILVGAKSIGGQEVEVAVGDDGVGLPPEVDWRRTKSLGLQLVVGLVESQLGGSVAVSSERGTCFTIRFKVSK